MSHHYSGPDFSFPHGDARLDLCDLFAFPKPGDSSRSIIIMDMHPSAGVNPPGPTTTEPFAPGALYELKIDTDGDSVADISYTFRFSASASGEQTMSVQRVEGSDAAGVGRDGAGQVLVGDALVSAGPDARISEAGDHRFFAGWRSDPFFFDAGGALNNFQFTGDDFFADKNVCSIALDLPNSMLGSARVGLWHRVLVQDGGATSGATKGATKGATGGADGWVQADRGAHTQQSTILCPPEQKALYAQGEPADDARFLDSFAHVLEQVGGYTPEEAKRVAGDALPDILTYNPSRPVEYPSNGRLLTDDVSDTFFAMFTNGKVTEDKVGPHTDLLTDFPYLGPPHSA